MAGRDEERFRVRPGDDPEGFVVAHVRRLEARRRGGIFERQGDGAWRVPPDYLDRAAQFEGERSSGAVVYVRSHLSVGRQARALGATWLDQALIDGIAPPPTGFGAAVKTALVERRAFLVEEGLATRRGQLLVLARDLLSTLRDREVAAVGSRLAGEVALEHRTLADGDRVRAASTVALSFLRAAGSLCSTRASG